MDARDIRIGNYVTDEWESSNTIIRVDSINDKGINLEITDDGNWSELAEHFITPYYEIEALRGIVLSEEVLLKCGFRKSKLEGYDVHFKYSHPLLHTSICAIYNADFSIKLDDIARKIKHLHQLQNLFFAITGEELQVNL